MKKILFSSILFIAAAIVLAGCSESTQVVDCGNDLNCLKEQMNASCGPAIGKSDKFGVQVDLDLKPLDKYDDNSDCSIIVHLKNITLPDSATDAQRAELARRLPLLNFAYMECHLKKTDSYLLVGDNFLTKPELLNFCPGPLRDLIKEKLELFNAGEALSPQVTPTIEAITPSPTQSNLSTEIADESNSQIG